MTTLQEQPTEMIPVRVRACGGCVSRFVQRQSEALREFGANIDAGDRRDCARELAADSSWWLTKVGSFDVAKVLIDMGLDQALNDAYRVLSPSADTFTDVTVDITQDMLTDMIEDIAQDSPLTAVYLQSFDDACVCYVDPPKDDATP